MHLLYDRLYLNRFIAVAITDWLLYLAFTVCLAFGTWMGGLISVDRHALLNRESRVILF
jgi:hypothetical protein